MIEAQAIKRDLPFDPTTEKAEEATMAPRALRVIQYLETLEVFIDKITPMVHDVAVTQAVTRVKVNETTGHIHHRTQIGHETNIDRKEMDHIWCIRKCKPRLNSGWAT